MKRTGIFRSIFVICASVWMMMCNAEEGTERTEGQEAKGGDNQILSKAFSGKVLDQNNTAIAGATVIINGISRTTTSTGQYAMSVADSLMGYHLEVQKNGYAPASDIYWEGGFSLVHRLQLGNTQLIEPTRNAVINERSSGIQVSLSANALRLASGALPVGMVRFTIIPLSRATMPGDLTAVTNTGAKVALETLGAVTLQAADSQYALHEQRSSAAALVVATMKG